MPLAEVEIGANKLAECRESLRLSYQGSEAITRIIIGPAEQSHGEAD